MATTCAFPLCRGTRCNSHARSGTHPPSAPTRPSFLPRARSPAFAYAIDAANSAIAKNDAEALTIPLKGFAIGDGWIDPIHMIPAYPDMMLAQGLVDVNERAVIADYCTKTVSLIEAGQMEAAFAVWDEMLNGDVYPYPNYFHNVTGSNDYDNFLRTNAPAEFGWYSQCVDLTRRDVD